MPGVREFSATVTNSKRIRNIPNCNHVDYITLAKTLSILSIVVAQNQSIFNRWKDRNCQLWKGTSRVLMVLGTLK